MIYILREKTYVNHRNLDLLRMAEFGPMRPGQALFDRLANIRLEVDEKEAVVPDCFPSGKFLTISGELKAVLHSFGVNAEYIPVEVGFKSKSNTKRVYYFLNVLEIVDCLDSKRSIISRESDGVIQTIDQLAIKNDFAGKLPQLFLVKGVTFLTCVLDPLKQAVQESGCSGIGFVGIEDYKFPS